MLAAPRALKFDGGEGDAETDAETATTGSDDSGSAAETAE